MWRYCLIAALIILVSGVASASTWQRFILCPDKSYDIDTIRFDKKGVVDVWVKSKHEVAKRKARYSYSIVKFNFYCRANRMAMIEVLDYDKGGNVIDSRAGSSLNLQTPVPDSVGEAMYKEMCTLWETSLNVQPDTEDKAKQGKPRRRSKM